MTNHMDRLRMSVVALVMVAVGGTAIANPPVAAGAATSARIAVSPPGSPSFGANAGDLDVVLSNDSYYAFTTGTALGNHIQVLINTSGNPTNGFGSYTGQSYGSTALPNVPAWQQVDAQTFPGVAPIGGHWVMWFDASLAGHPVDSGFSCLAMATAVTLTPSSPVFTDNSSGSPWCPARIGIHAGLAIVGILGGKGRRDASVFGDAANVASRIQGVAEPGGIVISGEARRLLRERWDMESLGHPPLRGVGTEVEVLSVGAPAVALGPDVDQVHPLVGRQADLGVLASTWSEVLAGTDVVLPVEGEAAVGKSRLVYEFLQEAGPSVPWLTVQCSPMTSHVPFAPFLPNPSLPVAAEGRSPEERRANQLRSLLDWVRGLVATRPGVLHVEDAHWADPSTGELIEQILDDVHGRPLLVLCTVRPTEGQQWLARNEVRRLRIGTLSDAEIRELVGSVAVPDLSACTIEDITERADGLPLFAEQLAAAMTVAPDALLPVTLQALLMARLDQLGPDARMLLQRGSAIRREFDGGLLAELLPSDPTHPEVLRKLVSAGILSPTSEGRYKFRHALLHEAAHESMLHSERRTVHGTIVSVLEERYRPVVDREPSLMGYYLEEARDARAVLWFERAGTRVAESAVFLEATGHFERALALVVPDDAATELRLRIRLGNSVFGSSGFSAAASLPAWTRAPELARGLGEATELTSALNGEATY